MKKAGQRHDMSQCIGIGVDVSKAHLQIAGLTESATFTDQLPNQRESIRDWAQGLVDGGYTGMIVCEATGHYHLLLELLCCECGLDIRVVNPLQSSKHAQSMIRKTKTDKVDAKVLAQMCINERYLPVPSTQSRCKLLIRLKLGQLSAIEKQLQQVQRSRQSYRDTLTQLGMELMGSDDHLHKVIDQLKQVKRCLHQELETLFAELQDHDQLQSRLQSIPGVSNLLAGILCHCLRVDVKDANAWVAYVGLDVRESGQWRGRGRLTKRGNSYLRKRLFQAAWGAKMHDERVRVYYQRLRDQGRNYVESLIIIARKLLKIAFSIAKHGSYYEHNKAFI